MKRNKKAWFLGILTAVLTLFIGVACEDKEVEEINEYAEEAEDTDTQE